MPEGPSIVILKELVERFRGRKIVSVKGNAKIEKEKLINKKVMDFRSWGKQFFICLDNITIRFIFYCLAPIALMSK